MTVRRHAATIVTLAARLAVMTSSLDHSVHSTGAKCGLYVGPIGRGRGCLLGVRFMTVSYKQPRVVVTAFYYTSYEDDLDSALLLVLDSELV